MNDGSTGSFVVILLFLLRCLIPLLILFGVSYLLQRLGLVTDYTRKATQDSVKEGTPPSKATSSKETGRAKKMRSTPRKRSRI